MRVPHEMIGAQMQFFETDSRIKSLNKSKLQGVMKMLAHHKLNTGSFFHVSSFCDLVNLLNSFLFVLISAESSAAYFTFTFAFTLPLGTHYMNSQLHRDPSKFWMRLCMLHNLNSISCPVCVYKLMPPKKQ